MPYTITYKFGLMPDVGVAIAGGHLARLTMEFTVDKTGTDIIRFAGDYGLMVKSWGTKRISREIDELVISPGQYNFSIIDLDDEFKTLLFEGADVPYTDKAGKVTFEIKYYGDVDYTREFSGYIDVTSINYSPVDKTIDFTCLPRTDLLKKKYIYNETDEQGVYEPNLSLLSGQMGISYSERGGHYYGYPINVKELIKGIYKVVNPYVNIEWQHSWRYNGINLFATPQWYGFTLDELKFTEEWLSSTLFSADNLKQIDTVYDLLTRLAFDFGFITGMFDNDTCFVKDIYYFDSNNLQPLGELFDHRIESRYNDLDAVRITQRYYERNLKSGVNNHREVSSYESVIPSGADMRGDNILDEEMITYGYARVLVMGDAIPATLTGRYNYNDYKILASRPSYSNYANDLATSLAAFYYNLRNRKKTAYLFGSTIPQGVNGDPGRVDIFKVDGIKYDYMKNISYGGNGYQIISLTKDYDNNKSEIEALYVVEYLDSVEQEPAPALPKPLFNVLPGGYLRRYDFNAEVKPEDINAGGTDLLTIDKGFELTKLIIKIKTAFDAVTELRIEDNDGVLIPFERISNQDDEVLESFIYKGYSTQQTIKLVAETNGTCTVGDADIMFELKTRS